MTDSLALSVLVLAFPEEVFDSYLDSRFHTAMTGSPANITPEVGDAFTAWDGYISGKNLELVRPDRIVQTWRAADFPEGAPDSKLTIDIAEHDGETKISVKHEGLPEGTAQRFTDGWRDFYFIPMEDFFAKGGPSSLEKNTKKPETKKSPAKKSEPSEKSSPAKGTKKAPAKATALPPKKPAAKTTAKKKR